jgi:hypothetical protein
MSLRRDLPRISQQVPVQAPKENPMSSEVTEKKAGEEPAAREETNKEAASEEVTSDHALKSVLFHDQQGGGGVDHTPIIITDGSASIEFTENLYNPVPGNPNRRRSTGLHLMKISAHRNHDSQVNPESIGRVCIRLVAGELYEMEFTCERAGRPPKNFIVGGGPTISPVLEFEHGFEGEYQKNAIDFPPIDLGQRFGNQHRNITRLQIFRIESDGSRVRIHDCGRAGEDCEYRILDTH